MAAMDVRFGNAGDFFAILPMMRKYRALHEQWDDSLYAIRPDAEARFHRWIGAAAQDPRSMLLVAEQDGQIVGFLVAIVETTLPIYQCDEYAVILELWVEPPYRRHGVAAALVERAATEYALLSSVFALSRSVAGWLGGLGAQSMGYGNWFLLTFFLAAPAYLLLPWVRRMLNRSEATSPSTPGATDVTGSR